ncbi:MAG: hypothetical protein CMF34_01840 [Leeuwenhoekiella sp.]|nr:hypothetical protein [Leeuwenhoekiella sp.]MBH13567.1 hypothetical protein [Leeuwenhoekiella sp.]HAX15715.1 hypothetical protein [Leeuwenhoekiella sp.]|tara:strand:- start:12034 stop:13215 length:1182 start_codon:yes stop_codon:yes gene_type:complete
MAQGLPGVEININTDRLGQTDQTEDSIVGLILTGSTVAGADNITTGTAKQLFSLEGAEAIGITASGTNAFAHTAIKNFYAQAGKGAELWIMLVTAAIKMSEILDLTGDFAPVLLDAAQGRIRTLAVSQKSAAGITVANGVDEDVDLAATKGQALAVAYAGKYKPVRVIIDGKDFNGTVADLKDYKTTTHNRVAILLAGTGGKNAAVGLLLGRIAVNPVQRSVARVRDGELGITAAKFTNDAAIETLEDSWNAIHNKGYIFLRTIPGKAGYFFTGDPTLTADSDDLASLKRVATIDKATLIALGVFTDNILDEIPLEENGKISPALIGNWKADIENAINQQMTNNGEISGCKATIDPDQDILGTSEFKASLDILPVGYSEYIKIDLGFTTSLDN